MRDVNTRMLNILGSNSGFDTIRGGLSAVHLARFLDLLELENSLPKTIIYPLDPGDYDTIAALIGCFQSSPVPGKLQLGPAWWFNDHKKGIVRQLESAAAMGLLGRFVGMVTDSRSFLSFPRHEYFRRILCNVIGKWAEQGEVPGDLHTLEGMIQGICYGNAVRYFNLETEVNG
jgi:glucuronate isomerase